MYIPYYSHEEELFAFLSIVWLLVNTEIPMSRSLQEHNHDNEGSFYEEHYEENNEKKLNISLILSIFLLVFTQIVNYFQTIIN